MIYDLKMHLIKKIKTEVPVSAGVYVFEDMHSKVLYIGKSVNLRSRMLSYFRKDNDTLESRIQQMIFNIRNFKIYLADSELEALLLEDNLIKTHLPDYNIRQKKFDNYCYLLLDNQEFHNFSILNWRDFNKSGQIFGPFPDKYFAERIIQLMYRHFNIRSCKGKLPEHSCLKGQIEKCLKPCRKEINPSVYRTRINISIEFLNGEFSKISKVLQKKMQIYTEVQNYEAAAKIRDDLNFCKNFTQRQGFIKQFSSKKLSLPLKGETQNRLIFHRGKIIRINDFGSNDASPLPIGNLNISNRHFLMDRANIVHQYILKHDIAYQFESDD